MATDRIEQFRDRTAAGKLLVEKFRSIADSAAIIYALPRGGVVIGKVMAKELCLLLDLILVKKIGHPLNPELAVGAVTETGKVNINPIFAGDLDTEWLKTEVDRIKEELARRQQLYIDDRPRQNPRGKVAVIVDDGIATGATMIAAVESIKTRNPEKVIVAVPVAPADAAATLRQIADEVIVLTEDSNFRGGVGAYYDNFPQISDDEVIDILRELERRRHD